MVVSEQQARTKKNSFRVVVGSVALSFLYLCVPWRLVVFYLAVMVPRTAQTYNHMGWTGEDVELDVFHLENR